MAGDADAVLMLAVQRGDAEAFRALFERHARAMIAFCRHFVHDADRAEELAQDVFLKLYRAAGRYRPDARFKTFLYRIAANHCLNELRRGDARRRGPDDPEAVASLPSGGATPQQEVEARALESAVGTLLARLPETQRAAFVLCRFEGLSYQEIADVLGTTVPSVKSLVHRATVTAAAALAPFVPESRVKEAVP